MVSKLVAQTRFGSGETLAALRKQAPGGLPRVLLAGLLVYLVIFAAWQLVLSDRVEWAGTVNPLTSIVADIGLVALVIIVLRKARIDGASRRAWIFILLASVATGLGNAIWAFYELVLHQEPFPSWADAAYLAFYPLMMLGLLSFPIAQRKPADRATFWLDTGVVLIASWMAIWYFVLGPTIESREPDLLSTVLSVAYPLGDFLLLYAVARILLRGAGVRMTPTIGLIVPSVVVLVFGDVGFAYLSLNGAYSTGHWIDLTWVLSPALIAVAAYAQLAQRDPDPAITGSDEDESSLAGSLLPYGAMALGYALLLTGSLQGDAIRLNGLVLGTIVLSGLVVGRQVLAFNDNHRLLHQSYELSQQLRESEARFRSLVQHGSDIILLLDATYTIRYISPSILRITGVPPEALADQPLLDRLHPDDRAAARTFLESSVRQAGFIGRLEVRIRHAEGSWLHVEAICSNQLQNPNVEGIVINARDITDRKMLEARLVNQANHDSLTGLANRKHFVEHLEQALHQDADAAEQIAVLFLDLDLFKHVNDSLGHSCGDELLVQVATRLREWAGTGMLPARLGGDEFTVLVRTVHQEAELLRITNDLQEKLDQSYMIGEHVVKMSPSIGIALGQSGRDVADDILRRADTAMYRVKAGRRPLHRI